ncbi:MAG: hypothetical protein FWD00_01610 [Clostridiales bacterium]|nr:hypothetical protein [Clostridiales bacterium]
MFKRLSEFEPTNSFIAYFDILGYKSIVERGIYDKKLAQIMESVIATFRQYNGQANLVSNEAQKLHMRIFSDNFIIYTGCDWESLINIVALMQGKFSFEGVFVKGAMCYGELYANNEFVFGKGLIDVVALEDKEIYPRIVLDDSFRNAICNQVQNYKNLSNYILSEDHTNYVNYIKQYAEACLFNSKLDLTWFLSSHQYFITENIKAHANCEKVLEKYVWSKKYHNRYCEENNYREFLIV